MNDAPRVALVTGANKGIGFETARQLAQQGVTVLVGARDEGKGEEAAARLRDEGLDARFVKFDATDPATHEAAAQLIEANFGQLDILVNNAGVMLDYGTSASNVPVDVLRQTFETNFFGVVAATQRLLPLIRQSAAGRIVNVSSILGSLTIHSDQQGGGDFKGLAYNGSKAALNAFTVHLAHDLRGTPVKVNSAHPGWVKTDMGTEAAPLDVSEGAKTSVWLATLPENGPTGGYFHQGQRLPW